MARFERMVGPGAVTRAAMVLAAGLLAVAGCRRPPPAPAPAEAARALAAIVASCASATGNVEVRRAGQQGYEPVTPGTVFRAGDEVRTGALASARIEFLAGGGLELEETAAVVVDTAPPPAAAPGEEPPQAEGRVAVKEGVVRGFLPEPAAGARAPAIVVAAADGSDLRLAAQGGARAAFRLTSTEEGTELAVTRGTAAVRGARGEATLEAGQVALASAGGVSDPAELIEFPLSLEPGIDARFQLVPGLAARLAWEEVEGAAAYRVQVARDLSFQRLVMSLRLDGTEASFVPKEAGMYAWRVAAVDAQRRQGEFGFARRMYYEVTPPRDLLVGPADAAVVKYSEGLPAVEFSWEAPGDVRACRLVVATGPDLLDESAVTEMVAGQRAQVRIPAAGEYYWGVYLETEGGPRPIFSKPRRLTVRKVVRPRAEVPRSLSRWGE